MPGVDRTRQSGGWLVAVGFSNLCWSIAAITLTASCVENSCVVDGDCVDGGVCDTVNGGFCVTRPDGGEVVGVDAGFDAGPPPPVCTPKCLDWQSCEVGSTGNVCATVALLFISPDGGQIFDDGANVQFAVERSRFAAELKQQI